MADFDFGVLAIGISVVLGIAGFVTGQMWAVRNRRDNVERARSEKATTERQLAKELRTESEQEAIAVRQEMREHVGQLLDTLKQDIALQREKIQGQMNMREVRIEQIKTDLANHMEQQNKINEKTLKAIEFVQTMLWGPEAKSMPPYMLGQEETKEHRDEPDVGMFTDPKKKG